MKVPKPVRQVDEDYRTWIRAHQCTVAALSPGTSVMSRCFGPVDACHVRSRGAGGSDKANLYPACRKHHTEQHTLGIKSFGTKYGFVLSTVAKRLWRTYKEAR